MTTSDPTLFNLDFSSLIPQETVLKYAGQTYTLKEASGAAKVAYDDATQKGIRVRGDGKELQLDGSNGADLILLQRCLFDGAGRNPPREFIDSLPNRVSDPAIRWVKHYSDIGPKTPEKKAEAEKQAGE